MWQQRYAVFCEKVDRLRERDKLTASLRELDRYLWLFGLWIDYEQGRQINREARALFDDRHLEIRAVFGAWA